MIINATPPTLLSSYAELDLEPQVHKYMLYRKIFDVFPKAAIELVEYMSQWLKHEHKRIVVDLKVREHDEGECVCIPGWHLDCTVNPNHSSRPENHIIYSTVVGTEFVAEPVYAGDATHFREVLRDDFATIAYPPNSIVQYSRDLHRGPLMPRKGRRILLRITETDII